MPIVLTFKKAISAQGMTREQIAHIVDCAPRHLQAIENEEQMPSPELFIQFLTMFNISIDEYIFPNKEVNKSFICRDLDAQLDNFMIKNCKISKIGVQNLLQKKRRYLWQINIIIAYLTQSGYTNIKW